MGVAVLDCWARCPGHSSSLLPRWLGWVGVQVHKDSYGRFAADSKAGDNTSLGWNDFMRMSDFLAPGGGARVEEEPVVMNMQLGCWQ